LVELVTDYLEEKLPPAERERFETHLGVCPGCQAYLDQIRRTIGMTGSLTEESIPTEARDRLLETFRDWKRGE
jgi:anti-sigma factor RsiW